MYCPSCGKQIPDKSMFCLYCGNSINLVTATHEVTDWQYKDFTYEFIPTSVWVKVGSGGYTEAGARIEFWQQCQQEIQLKLQQWLDERWEPVGEIGPASIKIRTYTGAKYSPIAWIIIFIVSLPLFLLPLLFFLSTYAEPVEFRIKMRRAKTDLLSGIEDVGPTLIVIELIGLFGQLGGYGVFIDDQKVGTIRNGRTERYQVQPGTHTVCIKVGFITSGKLSYSLGLGEEKRLCCKVVRGFPRSTKSISSVTLELHLVMNEDITRTSSFLFWFYQIDLSFKAIKMIPLEASPS